MTNINLSMYEFFGILKKLDRQIHLHTVWHGSYPKIYLNTFSFNNIANHVRQTKNEILNNDKLLNCDFEIDNNLENNLFELCPCVYHFIDMERI